MIVEQIFEETLTIQHTVINSVDHFTIQCTVINSVDHFTIQRAVINSVDVLELWYYTSDSLD